jgi:hypothetical protein
MQRLEKKELINAENNSRLAAHYLRIKKYYPVKFYLAQIKYILINNLKINKSKPGTFDG